MQKIKPEPARNASQIEAGGHSDAGGEKKEVKAEKADPDEKKEKEAPAGAKPEKK